MADWDETVDFLIIGSGGGSMCAALACKDLGIEPLILEKEDMVGGSTAMSGGILWIPANSEMLAAGVKDDRDQALTYLNACTPDQPGATPERKKAYINTGPRMMEWLKGKDIPFIWCDGWSDYYDEKPGGQPRGRSVGMRLFNTNKLGKWKDKLRGSFFPVPVQGNEGHKLALAARSWKGFFISIKVALRTVYSRLGGFRYASNGRSIQGWMLYTALKQGIEPNNNVPVSDLIVEDGRVTGVIAKRDGREVRIRANKGVLINSGGFARNADMRKQFGPQPSSAEWTVTNPGDTGEMIQTAMRLGAATHGLDRAIWCTSSVQPNGKIGLHSNELGKPHILVVGPDAQRFTDEACSYMETGVNMYKANAVPCWAIMDSRHRSRYPWALTLPKFTPSDWISSGYMKKADSVEDLAAQTNLDPVALKATLDRFNGFARTGKDLDFHRGERAYDRYWGDPRNTPNPCLGEVSEPPFYAVQLVPGDVGTYGGMVTDENGRVLREDGSWIEGLYATGNCTAGVTGACYPGAGASIGASFIFGYRAAHDAAGRTLPIE